MQKLSNLTLRRKLLGSFGLLLAVLVLLTSAAYRTTVLNQDSADAVVHTLEVISAANAVQTSLVDMETSYRGFLLTGSDIFLDPYREADPEVAPALAQLADLTADNPTRVAQWRSIAQQVEEWRTTVTEPGIQLRRDVSAGRATDDDLTTWVSSGEGRRRFTAIRQTFNEAVDVEEALLRERQQTAADAGARLQLVLIVGTIGAAALAVVLALLLTADIAEPVGRLAATARRIADGDLSQRIRLDRSDEVGVAATAFDQMTEQLQAIIVRNEAILGTAAEGIVGLDTSGRVTFANPAAASLIGITPAILVGQEIGARVEPVIEHVDEEADALTHQQAAQQADPIGTALAGTTAARGEADLVTLPDQERLPIEYACAPIHEAGAVVGAVLTFRDVTERRANEQALQDRARELARSNADLEQFAYVASHDLQEPLRAVVSYLQLLDRRYRNQLDERADRYIGYAVDGARRMQTLINDLLTYSRVGRRGEQFQFVDTEALLERVLAGLSVVTEESGATITHDPLPAVWGDATQLGQVFQNLIGNAIKFQGEAPPKVHISAAQQDGDWCFSIRDNGIGIAPEYHDRVFVLFQRLHGRDEYPGTGIGLAVCKKIIERHGGHLWIKSNGEGAGTTFWFTLPDAGGSTA